MKDSSIWMMLAERGPMCLTEDEFRAWEYRLPEIPKKLLRAFFQRLDDQSRWIVKMREEWEGEANRIRLIGEMMRRGRLRSYTDERGRIYVADDLAL